MAYRRSQHSLPVLGLPSRPERGQGRGGRTLWLVAGAMALFSAGCEVARPLDTFEGGVIPEPPESSMDDFGNPDDMDFGPAPGATTGGTLPGTTGGSVGGTTTAVGGSTGGQTSGEAPSSSGGTGDVAPGNPLAGVVGDYYFRLDEVNVVPDAPMLGRVTGNTETYGQIRINVGQDGVLTGVERLCHTETTQDARNARSIETWMDPSVPGEIAAITRTFEISEEGWSTDEVRRRWGWKAGPQGDELPTDPQAQKDVIFQVEDDGFPGMRVHAEVTIALTPRACAFDVVSYTDSAYGEGRFDDAGGLASATILYGESDSHAFYGTPAAECDTSDLNNGAKGTTEGEVTLRKLDQPLADFGACAPESDFARVF